MAATLTTTTQIAAPVNVVLQRNLLTNARACCPYFTGTQAAHVGEHMGSFTAKWRRYENLTPVTTALSELTGTSTFPTGRDSAAITVTDVTKAVAKYGNYLLLNEEVNLVNITAQSTKLSEVMGINAGESLNMLQRNEVEDNATLVYANGGADSAVNTIMTASDIKNVVNTLQRNKAKHFTPMSKGETSIGTAPIRKSFWGITHYDVEEDIRAMTGFRAVETYAGQTETAEGEFGAINGVRWLSTSEASIDTDVGATGGSGVRETTNSKADLYTSVIFGMDAVGSLGLTTDHLKQVYKSGDRLPAVIMIAKGLGSAGAGDPYDEVSSLAWKSWHGAKILNANWIRGIRSAASAL